MYRATTILLTIFILVVFLPTDFVRPPFPTESSGYVGPVEYESQYLFTGDIMLARYVETLLNKKGMEYPLSSIRPLRSRYDEVIANFEAPIPLEHSVTPTTSLTFSVASSSVRALDGAVSIVSLANNHTFDYGESGFFNTQQVFDDFDGVTQFGHPREFATTSSYVLNGEGGKVKMIAINAVGNISTTTLASVFTALQDDDEIQIIYVHWGEEYSLVHSDEQEALAKQLIDAGADAIIGHHPHVVQDVGWYKGVPIFYSLGNLVFDQYFQDEVQTHLVLELAVNNNELYFRLIPMTSRDSESSPRFMAVDERQQFLSALADRSDPLLNEELLRGRLWVSTVLASS